ncbi:hypothetical protein WDW89_26210 [Deltaproteobacteria bacterium TL4]
MIRLSLRSINQRILKTECWLPWGGLLMVILFMVVACSELGIEEEADNQVVKVIQYTLGGKVEGLKGIIVLQNNEKDDLIFEKDSEFTFALKVGKNAGYKVKVKMQPEGQNCTVINGEGVAGTSEALETDAGVLIPASGSETKSTKNNFEIKNVKVRCSSIGFKIGGIVTGLAGSLVLELISQNAVLEELSVGVDSFVFNKGLTAGNPYQVRIKSNPSGQLCAVTNEIGIAKGYVSNIQVNCNVIQSYPVGGTVSGLSGSVTLQNNGGNDLAISANGTFTFSAALTQGATYSVMVSTQPSPFTCSVSNNVGVISAAVTDIEVRCSFETYQLSGTISGLSGEIELQNNGSDALTIATDGDFTFDHQVANGSGYHVTVSSQPTNQRCAVNNHIGVATTAVNNLAVYCWSYVDGAAATGLNKNTTRDAQTPQIEAFNANLYVAWSELDETNGTTQQIRVKVYNGDDASPSWLSVDGDGAYGLNEDASQDARTPQLVGIPSAGAFDSGKLYLFWNESNGSNDQIRYKIFNGDDLNPVWSKEYEANILNYKSTENASAPHVILADIFGLGNMLSMIWSERNSSTAPGQIRVKMSFNSFWAPMDGNHVTGINKDPLQNATHPKLAVVNSKLYAAWTEATAVATQIRVAVYAGEINRVSWKFIDGNGANGINKDASHDADEPSLVAFPSAETSTPEKLYVIWKEFNQTSNQVRVAAYNGNDGDPQWTYVDGSGDQGINKDVTEKAYEPQLLVFKSKLYAYWREDNGDGQIRVAVYNGNDQQPSWEYTDGNGLNGLNFNGSEGARHPQMTILNSKLYTVWDENDASTDIPQIRAAVNAF